MPFLKPKDLVQLINGHLKWQREHRGNNDWDCKACGGGQSCYNGKLTGLMGRRCYPIKKAMERIFDVDWFVELEQHSLEHKKWAYDWRILGSIFQ